MGTIPLPGTYRNQTIEFCLTPELILHLGGIIAYVDTDSFQRSDRTRVNRLRVDTSTSYLKPVAGVFREKRLGHLAACRVACAEKQHLGLLPLPYPFLSLQASTHANDMPTPGLMQSSFRRLLGRQSPSVPETPSPQDLPHEDQSQHDRHFPEQPHCGSQRRE